MAQSKTMRGALALALLMGGMATASAQGILDRMKEDAQRRAENKAVMDAENPAPAKKADEPTTAATPAAPAPAESTSATPATPATPAPAPAQ
jgi:hypothetical protein